MYPDRAEGTIAAIRQRVHQIRQLRATNEPQAQADERQLLWEFVELIAKRGFAPFRAIAEEIQTINRD